MIMAIAFVGFSVKAHDLRRSFLFFFFGTNQLPKCYCLVRQLTQWVSKSKFRVAKVTTFILRVVTSDQKSSFASSAWFNSGGSFYSAPPLLTTEHCSSWWFLQPVCPVEPWEHCTRKTMTRSERCCFADLFALFCLFSPPLNLVYLILFRLEFFPNVQKMPGLVWMISLCPTDMSIEQYHFFLPQYQYQISSKRP